MKIRKPAYFDDFRCLASSCPDSCCKEWDVDVDEAAAALYASLSSPLGDRLRQVLRKHEDGTGSMEIINGRCPMWREDGLCRIQVELGHDALCKTCRDFPRLTHDYGDFIEMGLELSCPEAARMILSAPVLPPVTQEYPGGEAPEYDTQAMEILLRTRETARNLLLDASLTVPEALAVLLIYGYQAQEELDGEEAEAPNTAALLRQGHAFASNASMGEIIDFFLSLEILNPAWKTRLEAPAFPDLWQESHRKLAIYFLDRYWLQAVSDYDLVSRVKFTVLSCLVIRYLGGVAAETSQAYSKEIENSAENMDALLDAAYAHPAFTDTKLLGLLLA